MKGFFCFQLLVLTLVCDVFAVSLEDMVHVKGERLSSRDVLKQLEEQTDFEVDYQVNDRSPFRKDYDHYVNVRSVLNALREFNEAHNHITVEILDRGHGKLVIREKKKVRNRLFKGRQFGKIKNIRKQRVSQSEELESTAVDKLLIYSKSKDKKPEKVQAGADAKQKSEADMEEKMNFKMLPSPLNVDLPDIVEDSEKKVSRPVLSDSSQATSGLTKKEQAPAPKEVKTKTAELNTSAIVEIKGPEPKIAIESQPDIETKKSLDVSVVKGSAPSLLPVDLNELDQAEEKMSHRLGGVQTHYRMNELNFSDLTHPGFTGPLTGFMFPRTVSSRVLKKEKLLQVQVSAQKDKESDLPTSAENFNNEYYQVSARGRMPLGLDMDAFIEAHAGIQDGDLVLTGASNRSLDLAFGDTVLGLNYLALDDIDTSGRLMGGLRLKVPTGSKDNLTGTGAFDGGVHLAYFYEFDENLVFAQMGMTKYGDHDKFSQLDSRAAFSAAVGVEHILTVSEKIYGKVNYSQSPFKNTGQPSFYHKDIADLQLGLMSQYIMGQNISAEVQVGLTEPAPDFGLQLNWTTSFN